MTTQDRDYVLGTHDEEIARLGLQHRVWRSRALAAWDRAGFQAGHTLLDIGCGPGYATLDLAELVGPGGRVVAVDRSRRFLDHLEAVLRQRAIGHVEVHERDLAQGALPVEGADGAWARWVFCFVPQPRDLLTRVAKALRPGGVLVLHEYLDYRTWRFAPTSAIFEEFVQAVMLSWRDAGGEPDIGLELPRWLGEMGFDLRAARPIVEVVGPDDVLWQWPHAFVDTGVQRLEDLGRLTPERAREIRAEFARREADPHALQITPAVIEIVAVKR